MATLKATRRTDTGSRKARKLREKGLIPGILYGHGEQSLPVTLNQHELDLAILHHERLLDVEIDGVTQSALIKDVQYDTLGLEILHVDLTRVDLDESVEVTVPVLLRGTPVGVTEGDGMLHQVTSEITIACLARAIPDDLRVQVNDMGVDDVIYLRDVPLPAGATLLDDPDTVLCSVSVVAEEEAPPVEEAAAEPEVIGEKKEEGEEEAAGAEQ